MRPTTSVSKQIFSTKLPKGNITDSGKYLSSGLQHLGRPKRPGKTKTYRYSIQKTKSIRTETEYLHTINLKKILATWTVWNVNFSLGHDHWINSMDVYSQLQKSLIKLHIKLMFSGFGSWIWITFWQISQQSLIKVINLVLNKSFVYQNSV